MKIALYMEEGFKQIVLTPESEIERALLEQFDDRAIVTNIHRGTFYRCQGGWVRESDEVSSVILVLRPVAERGDRS